MPFKDGVFFRTAKGPFSLKGRSLYKLVTALVPHLDGETTVAQLCANVGAQKCEVVRELIRTLLDKGAAQPHEIETVDLPGEIIRHFSPQIGFIEHCSDRPLTRFAAFRKTPMLLIGSGTPLESLGIALARNGAERLKIAPLPDGPSNYHLLRREALETVGGHPRTRIDFTALPPQDIIRSIQEGLVLFASERPRFGLVAELNRLCIEKGVRFLPAMVFAGKTWIGPFVHPERAGCWMCAILRLTSNLPGDVSASFWKGLALADTAVEWAEELDPPAARILGNALAFEAFKALAGHLAAESATAFLTQDLKTLETERCPVTPHPLCPVCSSREPADVREKVPAPIQLQLGATIPPHQQLERASKWQHPLTGFLSPFDDQDRDQLPLFTTSISFRNGRTGCEQRVGAASAESLLEARRKALGKAVAKYALTLADVRPARRTAVSTTEQDGVEFASPDSIFTWSGRIAAGDFEISHYVPGFSILRKRFMKAPAASIYPATPLNARGAYEITSAGVAAGNTFSDIVRDGAFSALAYDRLRGVASGSARVFSLDPDRLRSLDRDVDYLLKLAERLDRVPGVYAIEAAVDSASVVIAVDDLNGCFRCAAGCSLAEAAKEALLEFVAEVQDPTAFMAADMPWFAQRIKPVVHSCLAETGYYRSASFQQVCDTVFSSGRDLLYFDLTPGDVVVDRSLLVGRILLTRFAQE